MLTIGDLRKRMERLEALSLALAKERAIIREAQDPLLYLERRRYPPRRVAAFFAQTDAVLMPLSRDAERWPFDCRERACAPLCRALCWPS